MRKIFKFILLLAIMGSVFHSVFSIKRSMVLMKTVVGKPATSFELQTLQGEVVSFQPDKRKGRKALLFFWTTWCPECRQSTEELRAFSQQVRSADVDVYMINSGESRNVLNKYFDRRDTGFPVLMDENSAVARQYHILGIPSYVYIDEKGIIMVVTHTLMKDFFGKEGETF